jgi:hypothetical protein
MGFNIDLNNNQGKNANENSEESGNNRNLLDGNIYEREENTSQNKFNFLNSLGNRSSNPFNSNNNRFSEINTPGSESFENQINNQGFSTQQSITSDAILEEVRRLSSSSSGLDSVDVDDIYYQNFSEESFSLDTKLNNIVSIIQKSLEKSDLSNSFPNILSHEIFKYDLRETSLVLSSRLSNDNSLSPEDVFNLKKSYIKNIHEMNAQRFFVSCDINDKQKDFHYKNLKESFEELKSIKENIEEIINKKDEVKKSINFANLVNDFFLENSNSNVFGFIYNNIFTNDAFIDSTDSQSDTSFLSYSSEIQNEYEYFSTVWLSKVYNNLLRFTSTRNSVNSPSILNSDKMIGQLLVNASLADRYIYNNTLGYDLNIDSNSAEIKNFLSFKEVEKFSIVYLNYKNKDAFAHNNSDLTNVKNYNKKLNSINNFYKLERHKSETYFNDTFLNEDLESVLDFLPYASKKKYVTSSISEIELDKMRNSSFIPFIDQDDDQNKFIFKYNDYIDGIKQYDFIGTYKNVDNNSNYIKLTKLDANSNSNNSLRKNNNKINSPTFLYFKYHEEGEFSRQSAVSDRDYFTNNSFDGKKISLFGEIESSRKYFGFLDTEAIKLHSKTANIDFERIIYCNTSTDLSDETIKEKIKTTYKTSGYPQQHDKSFDDKNTFYKNDILQSYYHRDNRSFDQFYLLENTNNCYKLTDMKNKFLILDGELTDDNESFKDRILLESYSESNQESSVVKKLKSKNKSNNWFEYSYNIKKSLGNLKHLKINSNDEASFFSNYLSEIRNKSLDKSGKDLLFFHGKDQENSIYSLEDSDLLIDLDDTFYSKNNFIKSNSNNVLSTNEVLDVIEDIDLLNTEVSSNNIREFLTFYYPKSFLRNSKSVIVKALKDSKSCLKWDKRFKSNFGYIKLLSDAVSNSDNNDTIKFLIFTSLVKKNDLDFFNNWDNATARKDKRAKLNEILNYDDHIKNIFGYESLKKQKTYTLRTIKKDLLNGRSLIDNDKILGILGGSVVQFLFPFKTHVKTFKRKERKIQIFGDYDDYICINRTNPSSDSRTSSTKKSDIRFINDFLSAYTFNYDSYISKYDYSEEIEDTNFDIENSNCYLRYLSLNNSIDNSDGFSNDNIKDFIYNPGNEDNERDDNKISIGNKLNYAQTSLTNIYDFYPINVEKSYNFSKKIHNFIIEILTYLEKVSFDNVDDIEDFINSDELIENVSNLLKSYCQIFSSYYEKINEMMINIYTNKIITNTLSIADINDELDSLWDESADFYFKEIDFLVNKFEKSNIPFDFSISNEESMGAEAYNSEFLNLYLSLITLNNSDCFESLTYDLIHGYLVNLEANKTRLQDISNKSSELLENIDSLIEENVEFPFDANNILDNNIVFVKLSKIF